MGVIAKRVGVFEGEFHEKVVRMLAVDDRFAVGCFARLEEFGITFFGDGGGVEAEH